MNLIEGRDNIVAIAPAEAGDQRNILLLSELRRFEHVAHSERVDGDGLLAEHVFSSLDAGAQMRGPESGRRGENDDVDSTVDEFLISVEAEKYVLRFDLDLRAVDLAELFQASVDAILIDVGDGGELGVIIRLKSLRSGSGATASASDQTDFDRVGRLSTHQRREPGGEGGCSSLEEITAVFLLHFVSVVGWGLK